MYDVLIRAFSFVDCAMPGDFHPQTDTMSAAGCSPTEERVALHRSPKAFGELSAALHGPGAVPNENVGFSKCRIILTLPRDADDKTGEPVRLWTQHDGQLLECHLLQRHAIAFHFVFHRFLEIRRGIVIQNFDIDCTCVRSCPRIELQAREGAREVLEVVEQCAVGSGCGAVGGCSGCRSWRGIGTATPLFITSPTTEKQDEKSQDEKANRRVGGLSSIPLYPAKHVAGARGVRVGARFGQLRIVHVNLSVDCCSFVTCTTVGYI